MVQALPGERARRPKPKGRPRRTAPALLSCEEEPEARVREPELEPGIQKTNQCLSKRDRTETADSPRHDYPFGLVLDKLGPSKSTHYRYAGSRRSLKITELPKWGTALADDELATSIIDGIVHHERLAEFTGTSQRTDASLMLAGARRAVWVEQIIDVGQYPAAHARAREKQANLLDGFGSAKFNRERQLLLPAPLTPDKAPSRKCARPSRASSCESLVDALASVNSPENSAGSFNPYRRRHCHRADPHPFPFATRQSTG